MEIKKTTFLCLDCEMTGLDPQKDRIVEVACVRFTLSGELDRFETLINPECDIPQEAFAIHRISNELVRDRPTIESMISQILSFVGEDIIIGHGVTFDMEMLSIAAKRARVPSQLHCHTYIDTLRLARYYGDSPNNSLVGLAQHFNVPVDESHRAMADVLVNIEVFKHLVKKFKTTEEIFKLLSRPIKMRTMPLGKHKGRVFSEIPLDYLLWAAKMNFDQDLLYSIRLEIDRRGRGGQFSQASNPFLNL